MGIETESDWKTWCVGQVSLVQTKKKGVLWSDNQGFGFILTSSSLYRLLCIGASQL